MKLPPTKSGTLPYNGVHCFRYVNGRTNSKWSGSSWPQFYYGRPLSYAIVSCMPETTTTTTLSVSGRPCYILLMFYLFIYFYGRLILWPWLTEVRESFTHGGPWVSLEKLLLGFFLVILKLQGGPKSDVIWRIFRPHPQTFCFHARTRQNIVILKNLVKHRWLLYTECHVSWTLAYKPLRSTRLIIVLKK